MVLRGASVLSSVIRPAAGPMSAKPNSRTRSKAKQAKVSGKVLKLQSRTQIARRRTEAARRQARLAKQQAKAARKLFKSARQVAKRAKAELAALSKKLRKVLGGVVPAGNLALRSVRAKVARKKPKPRKAARKSKRAKSVRRKAGAAAAKTVAMP